MTILLGHVGAVIGAIVARFSWNSVGGRRSVSKRPDAARQRSEVGARQPTSGSTHMSG